MKSPDSPGRPKSNKSSTLILILLVLAGLAGSAFTALSHDVSSRLSLKQRAQTIADSLPRDTIQTLHGNSSDLTQPAYQQLKGQMELIKHDNTDLRFAYLMGERNDKVFFYVDSEQPDSDGYSAPGDSYPEASAELKSSFHSGEAFVEGPLRDSYGIWLSGLAPIVDSHTGRVIAVAGIDVPGKSFYTQTIIYALVPLILAAVPFVYVWRQRAVAAKEQEIVQLKTQFVSIASHELRSPLTGMLWAIQNLMNEKLGSTTSKQKETLHNMYRSTEFSLATVNEILDTSIFERHKQGNLQREVVDLVGVIESVEATLKLGAQEQAIAITHAGDWPVHALTRGDVGALKRGFMNILSNAIKYSPAHSKITLHYERRGEQHVIVIQDQGIGIPKTELTKVLSGYYRASNATQVVSQGTGLGLWVTKAIIENHHGRLELASVQNKGTTVTVSLPAIAQPTVKPPIR